MDDKFLNADFYMMQMEYEEWLYMNGKDESTDVRYDKEYQKAVDDILADPSKLFESFGI